jgi:hypothetical protein
MNSLYITSPRYMTAEAYGCLLRILYWIWLNACLPAEALKIKGVVALCYDDSEK